MAARCFRLRLGAAQLIQQAGLKYFMTIKIGWSQYNRLPYDTFLWQGIDGTQILTHFITVPDQGAFASTYNAMADAREALGTWKNFQQKELHKDLLMAYGFGDGGGGPTREMLENIEVMKDFPALPQVRQSSTTAFFESIAPQTTSRMMPIWNGELYLEYHRARILRRRATNASTARVNSFCTILSSSLRSHPFTPITNTRRGNSTKPGTRFALTSSTTSFPARALVPSMKSRNSNMQN